MSQEKTPKLPHRYNSFTKPISEGVGSSSPGHHGPVWMETCSGPTHTCDRQPAWRRSPQGSLFVFEGLLWLSWGPGLRLPIVCGAGGPEGWRWATGNPLEFLVCPESLVFRVLEGWMGSTHLSVISDTQELSDWVQ